ncbi:MAG TPA: DUF3891 family protein [Gaiellaceae bacterium]|nr:DUF3891 family protein [Gaiellaceae bacterium]
MLLRSEAGGTVAIGQPAHAWVSGQLARAWAEPFEPHEEVCLAAEQHDVAWVDWERAPELDPETGLPYAFSALPRLRRLELWSGAAAQLVSQSRYAALLVSLHGTLLVERFPPEGGEEVAAAVAGYLERERAFQARLFDSLREDPRYAPHASEEAVARNRELVFAWDGLSLALLHGVREERKAAGLALAPVGGSAERVSVSPWPFRKEAVTVVCEGRVLSETFRAEEELRRGLARAPWVTVETRLVPS